MIILARILTIITTTNDPHQQLRTLLPVTKTPGWVHGAVAVAFGEISHLFKHQFGVRASSLPISFVFSRTQTGWLEKGVLLAWLHCGSRWSSMRIGWISPSSRLMLVVLSIIFRWKNPCSIYCFRALAGHISRGY